MADKWVWSPAACAVLLTLVYLLQPKFYLPPPSEKRPAGPVLQLPHDDAELQAVLALPNAQKLTRCSMRWDFGFIGAYTLFFLAFALFQPRPWRVVMIVVTLAAAAFDVWEDVVILRFAADANHARASDVWFPAQAKWVCVFAAMLLGATLFARAGSWWGIAIAIALAVPSLVGIAASLARSRALILLASRGLLLLIVAAFVLPRVVKRAG
jgi:hypothetical protein